MKRGPKPQPEAHRATKLIQARLTPAEHRIVVELAEAHEDGKISNLIKTAIGQYRPR